MNIHIYDLPLDIILLIKKYSDYKTINNLLLTTTKFKSIRNILYSYKYNLNNKNSFNFFKFIVKGKLKFTTNNKINKIENIQNNLLINDQYKNNNLTLDLSGKNIIEIKMLNKLFRINYCLLIQKINLFLLKINSLENLYSINLSYCNYDIDLNLLKNVKILNLSNCYKITDVDVLKNVHELNLTACYRITSVENLTNVKILIIRGCYGITNVNYFRKIYFPDLIF